MKFLVLTTEEIFEIRMGILYAKQNKKIGF